LKFYKIIIIFYIVAGNQIKVYDVAVNSEFFKKCQNNALFQSFIVSATIEGIAEKFKIEISPESILLIADCSISKLFNYINILF